MSREFFIKSYNLQISKLNLLIPVKLWSMSTYKKILYQETSMTIFQPSLTSGFWSLLEKWKSGKTCLFKLRKKENFKEKKVFFYNEWICQKIINILWSYILNIIHTHCIIEFCKTTYLHIWMRHLVRMLVKW